MTKGSLSSGAELPLCPGTPGASHLAWGELLDMDLP